MSILTFASGGGFLLALTKFFHEDSIGRGTSADCRQIFVAPKQWAPTASEAASTESSWAEASLAQRSHTHGSKGAAFALGNESGNEDE